MYEKLSTEDLLKKSGEIVKSLNELKTNQAIFILKNAIDIVEANSVVCFTFDLTEQVSV
jgi:hypothetical protein